MKKYILYFFLFLFSVDCFSETIEIKRDNGEPTGNCFIAKRYFWDESVAFKINAPCFIKKISVYLSGETPGLDTIWVCGALLQGNLNNTLCMEIQFPNSPIIQLRWDSGLERI